MGKLEDILANFDPITLKEMDRVALLNRTDTKYVFNMQQLFVLLEEVNSDYRILEIKDMRYARYKTLYYDTPDFQFFTVHQNGKRNRYKVRFRRYVDSNLCYLEIKFKNNKSRTVKSRVKVEDIETSLSGNSREFITKVMEKEVAIEPKLWNSFRRLTLVSNKDKERLTIDLDLAFEFDGKKASLPKIVIAEIKQERASRNSVIIQRLKEHGIQPLRMSKYCIGALQIYDDLKYNSFKPKLLKIKKVSDEHIE